MKNVHEVNIGTLLKNDELYVMWRYLEKNFGKTGYNWSWRGPQTIRFYDIDDADIIVFKLKFGL